MSIMLIYPGIGSQVMLLGFARDGMEIRTTNLIHITMKEGHGHLLNDHPGLEPTKADFAVSMQFISGDCLWVGVYMDEWNRLQTKKGVLSENVDPDQLH